MRVKDWLSDVYIHGRLGDICDVSWNMEDLVTGLKADQAERLIALISCYVSDLWWMYDRLPQSVQDEYYGRISKRGDPLNDPIANAESSCCGHHEVKL